MKTTIISQNLLNGNVKLTFPEFNTEIELHAGSHVNSKNNWSEFVPHGNCKKPVEMVFDKNAKISVIHRPKVDEVKYPNQMRYSMVIGGNFGGNSSRYTSTSDMRISEDTYNKFK